MTDQIFFDGKRYISAHDAAESSSVTRDYIARLCRDGKVRGRRVGKNWYVEEQSLKQFLIEQEYQKSLRNELLAKQREAEYRKSNPTYVKQAADKQVAARQASAPVIVPPVVHATERVASLSPVYEKLAHAVAQQSGRALEKAGDLVNAPSGIADAAIRVAHVPTYAITPVGEFVHKLVALTLAVMMTFGTYALVDPNAGALAINSVRGAGAAVADAYNEAKNGGATRFASNVKVQVAAAASNPASAFGGIPEFFKSIARTFNARVDSFVYAIAFPQQLTSSSGSVAIEIQPYAKPQPTPTQRTPSLAVTAPVTQIVKTVQQPIVTERIVQMGGISEAELNDRLNQLNNKLVAQIYGITSIPSSLPASGGYTNNIALSQRIDNLSSVDITNSTFTGGSISNSSIDATSLGVSGNTTLATTTVNGDLTVNGSVAMQNISLSSTTVTINGTAGQTANFLDIKNSSGTTVFAVQPDGTLISNISSTTQSVSQLLVTGNATATNMVILDTASTTNLLATNATTTNLFAVNASTTNATTTNFFAVNASTTNATTTNFFAATANFLSTIIDTFSATVATITNLTATNATTTNATTTNLAVTNLTSFTAPIAPYFIATSSSATSTFAGGFAVGTSQLLVQQGTGNVGIGTENPATNLEIAGTGSADILLRDNSQGGDLKSYLVRNSSANLYIGRSNDAFGSFTPYFTLQNGGNVGIGTTSPFALLSVAGSGFFDGDITATNILATSTLTSRGLATFASGFLSSASSTIGDGTQGGGLTISGGATTTGNLAVSGGYINFPASYNAATSFSILQNTNSQLQLNGGGNGILFNSSGNANLMTLANSGELGIGTTSPFAKLSVQGSGFFAGDITGTNITATGTLSAASLSGASVSSLSANYLSKWNSGTWANSIIFDNGTQLGIGTNSNLNGALTANGTFGVQAEGDIFRQYDSSDDAWYPIIARYNTSNGTYPASTYIFGNGINAKVAFEVPGGSNLTTFQVRADNSTFNGNLTLSNLSANTLLYTNGSKQVSSGSVGSSLTFSAGTLSLNTANANTWSALQQFANATTTLFSATQKAYFGTAGQSSFDFNGVLTLGTPLAQTSGGTGISSYTAGDILYADGSGVLQKLPIGADGSQLLVAAGLPSWGSAGGGSSGANEVWATTTNDQVIYPTNTTRSVVIGTNATTTPNSIFEVFGQQYISSKLGIATTSPSAAQLSVSGSGYFTAGLGVGVLNTAAGTLQTSGDATIGGTLLLPSLATGSLLYTNGVNQVAAAAIDSSLVFSSGTLSLNTSNTNTFSALQNFGGGLTAYASSTIGDGTQGGGLTISGGATTTGNAYFTSSALPTGHLSSQNLGGTSNYWGTLYVNDIALYNGSGVGISTTGSDINFFTQSSGASRLFIQNSSGNVGVGTTTPWGQLSASSTSAYPALAVQQNSTGPAATFLGGNVGIGTTSPLTKLSIQGTAGANDVLNVASSTGASMLYVNAAGNVGIGTATPDTRLTVAASGVNGLNLAADTSDNTSSSRLFLSTGTSNESIVFRNFGGTFSISTGGTVGSGAGSTQFLLTNASATFTNYLNIAGTTGTTTIASGQGFTIGGSQFVLQQGSGNVGIGTTTPTGRLHITQGTGQSTGLVIDAVGTQNPNFVFAQAGTSKWNFGYDLTNSYFKIAESGVGDWFAIKNTTGNVGIGTSSPLTKLSVQGTAGANDIFNIASSTGASILYVNADGNIGIGTTAPSSTVHIIGPAGTGKYSPFAIQPYDSTGSNNIQWRKDSTGSPAASIGMSKPGVAVGDDLVFSTYSTSASWQERLRIVNADGNVGIATTSPFAKFSVNGDGFFAGSLTSGNLTATGTASIATLNLTNDLSVANGGTGASTLTGVVLGNGTSAFTNASAQTCTNQFVRAMSAAYIATCATVDLTSDVTGTLAVANGGTGITSFGTGIATWLGTPTSANLAAALTNETGSGSAVFGTSPTFTSSVTITSSGNASIEHGRTDGVASTPFIDFHSGATAVDYDSRIIASGGTGASGGGTLTFTAGTIATAGNVGIGTTTPFRKLSITDTVAAAQVAIAYDATRYAQLQVDSTGDFHINPSGSDTELDDGNLWVCAGGSCPAGTPTGNGNLIVESKVGIGTSAPSAALDVAGDVALTGATSRTVYFGTTGVAAPGAGSVGEKLQLYGTSGTNGATDYSLGIESGNLWINSGGGIKLYSGASQKAVLTNTGNFGIGTTSPSAQLAVANQIFVGAGGATGMGTATSTFYGDIKINGKLDVSTIDPPYTIDGTKYATFVPSMTGVKEETAQVVQLSEKNADGKYAYTIDFDTEAKGSDLWLFFQVTDLGEKWQNLTVLLTPSFEGSVYYKKLPNEHKLMVYANQPGEVSMRLTGNRYDFTKWPNLRKDQDGNTEGTHVISSKPKAGSIE